MDIAPAGDKSKFFTVNGPGSAEPGLAEPELTKRRQLKWAGECKSYLHVLYLIEKINHLKINHAKSRKTSRKRYLKINRKVRAKSLRNKREPLISVDL